MGFGVAAWIDLLETLIYLYIFLSILAVGLMLVYKNGDGLNIGKIIIPKLNFLALYSVGNLGYDNSVCYNQMYGLSDKV